MKIHQWQNRKNEFSLVDNKKAARSVIKYIKNGDKILDIGCGDCIFFDFIRKKADVKMYAYDVVKESLEIAKKKGYTTCKSLNLKEKFNVITMFEVIEHLDVNQKIEYVKIINKILSDNGYLILSFPNVRSILSMQNYFNNIEHKTPIMNENNLKILFSNYKIIHKSYLNPWVNPLKVWHSFVTGFGFSAIFNNVLLVLKKR